MKKLKKGIVLALALCLSVAAFSGCTDADKDADSSPSATPSASSSATPSASASPTETAVQSLKEITAAKEKVKLTMVLCDAGLTAPDGIDVSDNDWVNLVKDLANVELSIDQPVYADYDTKLQLRLSSNDLPDIVAAEFRQHDGLVPRLHAHGHGVDVHALHGALAAEEPAGRRVDGARGVVTAMQAGNICDTHSVA